MFFSKCRHNHKNIKLDPNNADNKDNSDISGSHLDIQNDQFWQVFCTSVKFEQSLKKCLTYAFVDIKPKQIEVLIKHVVKIKPASFYELGQLIYDWHMQLRANDFVGFKQSESNYLKTKGQLSTAAIVHHLVDRESKIRLYDIGTGDGGLSSNMLNTLQTTGYIHIDLVRIDLDDKLKWSDKIDQDKLSQRIYYAGNNLDQVMQADLNNIADEAKKDLSLVVSYNHSLHHWPNPRAQVESIAQLSSVVKAGTMVILKEHYNIMHDEIISLNHLLLRFRYNLIKMRGKRAEYTVNNRKEAGALFLQMREETGRHNFMSPFWLEEIMQRNNFELLSFTPAIATDPDQTVIYAFRKKSATAPNMKRAAYDDLDAYLALKKLERKTLLPVDVFHPKQACRI
jgi:hypothetical protein